MRLVSLALDSVDSLYWGCTTHFSTLLLNMLKDRVELADFPLLVRLNPGVPWKTRGNGAVVLRLLYDGDVKSLLEAVRGYALEYSNKEDFGIAVVEGAPWEVERLRILYSKALTDVVTVDVARKAVEKSGGLWAGGMGVIGASAALAALAPWDDYTFELIAYRKPENWGVERCMNYKLLVEAEARMPPCTFNNIDYHGRTAAAAPGGWDPVLAGFRGDCIAPLAGYAIGLCEEVDLWALFRSNQHTDAHAKPLTGELKPYQTGLVDVTVKNSKVIAGGHVIVRGLALGGDVDIVFYRETGPLNSAARMLSEGDEITVLGTVKPYKPRGVTVIAAEKMRVNKVETKTVKINPRCPKCGTRMESPGRKGGLRCPKCGYKKETTKINVRIERSLTTGEYTPPPGRLKHLTSPKGRKQQPPLKLPLKLKIDQVLSTDPKRIPHTSEAHSSWNP
ncbi:MAG: tRNA(Ile)(2)-agmatinylcytidine synthase [Thermoprotei archaeon]|nr:tRNA(Ile)(2)-agmatinylcytidine synthase [Thermoprotei archaeon]